MTSQVELERFFEQVRAYQARSRADSDNRQVPELVDELGLVTEMLFNAEEELRVQSEQLAASRLELERMCARAEQLFGAAPAAYVITDGYGMVVEANRAGWQLLGVRAGSGVRRSLVSMVAVPGRQRVRALVGRAVAAGGQPVTATLTLAGGPDREVVVSVEARNETQSGSMLLRWQLTPASGDEEPSMQHRAGAGSPGDASTRTPTAGTATADAELSGLLSLARADLIKELSGEDDSGAMLTRVVELACHWVPGAEHASVCQFPRQNRRMRILAATNRDALACDKIQRVTEQGPAFDAVAEHALIHVDDLPRESRWRLFTTQSRDLGIRSILSCELPMTRGGAAALNLYSAQPAAFSAMAELMAPVFAARASIALAHADEVQHLHRAIESRQTIGQALGILVERHRLTPEQAFDLLVQVSKDSHIKLRDLAARISDTGEDPRDVIE